jgi:hypothetical protein
MKDDLLFRKLTQEIIEACISRNVAELVGRQPEEIAASDLQAEKMHFVSLLQTSPILAGHVQMAALFFYDHEWLSKNRLPGGGLPGEKVRQRVIELMESGVLTNDRRVGLIETCAIFLSIGWHARGAVEEAERLERMTGC